MQHLLVGMSFALRNMPVWSKEQNAFNQNLSDSTFRELRRPLSGISERRFATMPATLDPALLLLGQTEDVINLLQLLQGR